MNDPLFFYHIVDKSADLSNGLMSLQYMYDHHLYKLFDKNADKYINRISGVWNIPKYAGKSHLTREEILDALNIVRGPNGSNYIYFFRFAPTKNLGQKIKALEKTKNIYSIDLNDPRIKSIIQEISYGYDMNSTTNKKLDLSYYQSVSKEEYFANYNDRIAANFSTINHIGISFKNGYCPPEYLVYVDWL